MSIMCRPKWPFLLMCVFDYVRHVEFRGLTDSQRTLGKWGVTIKNYYSSLVHPQSNGQAEVTIRTLKAALKTKLENFKRKWVEYLPEVLWAYRTMQKSATRETPFALAFGTEAVAPVEIGLKSPRIELAAVEHNDEALRLNLDLLDEKREQVLRRIEDYQRKTARFYNQNVKPSSYMPGDLVLKKLLPARKNPAHGKLGPNWEGPYIVYRVVRPGNYELQNRGRKNFTARVECGAS